jgi:hypothetical protein
MERITTAERRARVAVRHHVSPEHRVPSAVDAARGMVCLHATDPATVYLSTWARVIEPSLELLDRPLYEDRQLLRMLAMRRTMFVVPTDEAPVLQAAASLGVARVERRRNEQLAATLGVDDPAGWMRSAEEAAQAELEARGEATAQELSRAVPALGRKVRVNVGKRYEGDIGVSSRVLIVLALEGRIVRARPRGTWLSSQYRWTTMEHWLGGLLPVLDQAEATARLVERWLARFGPGTDADLRWWTGLTARAIRAALASVRAVEVALEGSDRPGYLLPGDWEPTPEVAPWVALLPALDPTTMGWQARHWYLGDHRSQLFDTAGNAGPTVWVDGRIVGGWAIRDGEVVTGLLEDVGREAELTIEAEAARLGAFLSTVLGSSKVLPRFPTPYYRELLMESDGRSV